MWAAHPFFQPPSRHFEAWDVTLYTLGMPCAKGKHSSWLTADTWEVMQSLLLSPTAGPGAWGQESLEKGKQMVLPCSPQHHTPCWLSSPGQDKMPSTSGQGVHT